MDATKKSIGVTETERMLADFCERSFRKLWTYPNPYKDDGKELCDVLAVFGDHVFIFFDREKAFTDTPESDPMIVWDRWKRRTIDRQVITAHGAERYIRSGRGIFLDAKRTMPRSEEHTSELQSLMRISYAVFCLKKKKTNIHM